MAQIVPGTGAVMPELPDVETFRRRLVGSSLHRKIEHVRVLDAQVVQGRSGRSLAQVLRGEQMEKTSRRGKQMFVSVSDGRWLVMHFGMTGFVEPASCDDPLPRHARVVFELGGDRRLCFVDQRKLGFLAVVDDLEKHCQSEGLGPDALNVSRDDDVARLCGSSRARVKSLLMDQEAIAGIGNIYSDEILFQAHIDPRRKAGDLDENDVKRLHRQMRRVLGMAIDRHADPDELPRGWLLHHRDDGTPCTRGNGHIRRFSASGRGAFLCPECQR
ncbi:MAG TPA: DNA-formamidopyrimidine glycosylase family protein [Nocardioidaceae bacterium]|nr:DNA-formamidopyrimidine glycosylase family protein [Nocardioidaceae bacterium]